MVDCTAGAPPRDVSIALIGVVLSVSRLSSSSLRRQVECPSFVVAAPRYTTCLQCSIQMLLYDDRWASCSPEISLLTAWTSFIIYATRERMVDKLMFKNVILLLELCVSSLRRGHANLLCIVPILPDAPKGKQIENLIYTS